MTRLTTLALTLSLSGWFAAADTITLKPDVYVKGPTVLLGDVAVNQTLYRHPRHRHQ